MIKIQLKDEETPLTVEQADLSIDGWVVAEVTRSEISNRRWIPRENVQQIIAEGDADVISPSRDNDA